MLENRPVAALIPARGGSKSVERKNPRNLGGKPLVAWPIETANEVPGIDQVYVTTDDDDIAETSREFGASVINRPPELATDDALVVDAISHAIATLEETDSVPEVMTLLEPACPFRSADDVGQCLELVEQGYDSVATFVEAEVNPHRTWMLSGDRPSPFVDGANPWLPRQKLPEAYQLNGGCYAFEVDAVMSSEGPGLLFGESAGVVMPPERSVDIDSPIDLTVARTIYEEDITNE